MEQTKEKEREINTRIATDLKDHSGYRITLMATNRREMNGCWILNPIREGF
jgi:hypothetical protein